MQIRKRILSLLLAIVMIFLLCGCSSNDETPSIDDILGEWDTEIDLSEPLAEMTKDTWDVESTDNCQLTLNVSIEFHDDNKYTMQLTYEQDDLKEFSENYTDVLIESLLEQYENSGWNKKEYQTWFKSEYGQSMTDYYYDTVEKLVESKLKVWTEAKHEITGYYRLYDDKLYMGYSIKLLKDTDVADVCITLEHKDNNLTFKKIEGKFDNQLDKLSDYDSCSLPWTFVKA